ncbi:MAG: hypothetical protein IKB08_00060 [Clostridia bacterium]|nr:hypothetical protein [Clostridia bacterium]
MSVIINEAFSEKAKELKRPLIRTQKKPERIIEIIKAPESFQGLKVIHKEDMWEFISLSAGEEIILDFGRHIVGYLHFSLTNDALIKITDSPVKLQFFFGEFPLEIVTPPESYKGGLSNGWLQNEERSFVFTPCKGSSDRRYSFRYLKIRRNDNARFPVKISDITAECVSSVSEDMIPSFSCNNERLKRIYDMSVMTLKECQQDVFEDGPKRDRRLWIGDLKLQAMTDYKVFKNTDLIKRCIYLFASVTPAHEMVAPCIFPDSPPYVDEWTFADYSLFFISCLYDWYKNTGDISLVEELYPVAKKQAQAVSERFNTESGIIELNPFIDWCPGLDKKTALLGVFIYTLKQLKFLEELLGKDTKKTQEDIASAVTCLKKFFDPEKGLFTSESGQFSQHTQVWAVLSGCLTEDEARAVLEKTKKLETEYTMRTPYMMHYYIEALYNTGLKKEALGFIEEYWGKIADAGFDCCPEVFNPENEFESPYNAPEINSACHAWSCTPAYWIPELI